MTFDEIVSEVRALSFEKRKELIGLILDTFTQSDLSRESQQLALVESDGKGTEIWQSADAPDTINKLHIEWNDRA